MGKSTYTRKTTNPKMAWSEERKAKWAKTVKEAHVNGTWHKKTKKAVGLAISNGKKEAIKFKNRSDAMKKSWKKRQQKAILTHPPTTLSENLLDPALLPDEECRPSHLDPPVYTVKPKQKKPAPDLPIKKIEAFFDLVEKELGIRPDLNEFINKAIEDQLVRFWRKCKKCNAKEENA